MKKILFLVIVISTMSQASALSYAFVKNSSGTILEKVFFDETKTTKVFKINSYCYYQKVANGNSCEFFYEEKEIQEPTGGVAIGEVATDANFIPDSKNVKVINQIEKKSTTTKSVVPEKQTPLAKDFVVAKPTPNPVPKIVPTVEKKVVNNIITNKVLPNVLQGTSTTTPNKKTELKNLLSPTPIQKPILKSRGFATFFEGQYATITKHSLTYLPQRGDCYAYLLNKPDFSIGSLWVDNENLDTITLNIANPVATTTTGTSSLVVAWRCEK